MEVSFFALAFLTIGGSIAVIALASRSARRWRWLQKTLLGAGFFLAAWVALWVMGWLIGQAFLSSPYAGPGQVFLVALTVVMALCTLAALAVMYFVFGRIYEALGGHREALADE